MEDKESELPLYGYIHLDGWAGRSQQLVMYVRDTPKRIRIRAINRTRLAGRGRWLDPGEEALIPHDAFSFGRKPDVDVVKF
jgi:hypothetical protein